MKAFNLSSLTVIFLVSLSTTACGNVATTTTVPPTNPNASETATEPLPEVSPTLTPVPLTPTSLPQANPDEPVGSYRVQLPGINSTGISAGYYRLTMEESGNYRIDWSPTKAQDGMVGVNGTYTVDGNQIVFTDRDGFAACKEEDGVTGKYEWSLSSPGLSLTPIDDTCQSRLYVFSTKTLPRDR